MTSGGDIYTEEFFRQQRDQSRRTAEVVVPLVLELAGPRSVVDVGCGTGTWLAVFLEHGVPDVFGVDGDYVDQRALEIPRGRFLAHDLGHRLELARRFDLVVSFEVAEHLPPEHAETFVASLTTLGPIVLFSAAIPGQGSTSHLDEQWLSYWAQLFAARGYVHVDCLRRRLWHDESGAPWYAQNALLYVTPDYLARDEALARLHDPREPEPLALVHPTRYLEWIEWARRYAADPAT